MIIYLGYGVWHSSERRSEPATHEIAYDVSDNNDMIVDAVYQR